MGIQTCLLVPVPGAAMAAPARDLEKFFRNNGFANLIEQFGKHKVTMEVLADLTDTDKEAVCQCSEIPRSSTCGGGRSGGRARKGGGEGDTRGRHGGGSGEQLRWGAKCM